MVLSYLRDKDKAARDEAAAQAVSEVKTTLLDATAVSDKKLDSIQIIGIKAAKKAEEAAVKVEEVKATLEGTDAERAKTLDGIAAVGVATHTLVNDVHGKALESNMVMARRLADLTGSPVDHEAAMVAAKKYADHQGRQSIVDREEGKGAAAK
jgi:hypothetical protein